MRGFRMPAAALLLGLALGAAPAGAQDADSNVDKALQKVEALLSQLRAKPDADPKLVEKLEEVAADLRKEKEARGGSAAAPPAGGMGGQGGAGLTDWALNETKKSFVRGVDLTEEEKANADVIIVEFATDYDLAKKNEDEKSRKVIRDHTEGRIARTFPSKAANKLKDNLDRIIQFWEGRWGRGGR